MREIWVAYNSTSEEIYLFSDEKRALAFLHVAAMDIRRSHRERGFSLSIKKIDEAAPAPPFVVND